MIWDNGLFKDRRNEKEGGPSCYSWLSLLTTGNPKGVEVKGEWFDVSGHRIFRLFEADDAVHVAALFYDWTDLGVAELIPVVGTEFAIKMLKRTAFK